MARNIEIKLAVVDLPSVRGRAQRFADRGPFILEQVDYFFPVPVGRLKLRVEQSDLPESNSKAELIAYHRHDEATARASDYLIYPAQEPEQLRMTLEQVLGSGPVVSKRRELYLVGRTRIHLDEVEAIGNFVEIEVVMEDGEDVVAGHRELERIVEQLGLDLSLAESVAYADLLQQ